MTTVTFSEKGQVTVPSEIRKKAHIQPGTRATVEFRDGEIVMRPIKRLSELAGIFRDAAIGVTKDSETIRNEMEEAVAREVMLAPVLQQSSDTTGYFYRLIET